MVADRARSAAAHVNDNVAVFNSCRVDPEAHAAVRIWALAGLDQEFKAVPRAAKDIPFMSPCKCSGRPWQRRPGWRQPADLGTLVGTPVAYGMNPPISTAQHTDRAILNVQNAELVDGKCVGWSQINFVVAGHDVRSCQFKS